MANIGYSNIVTADIVNDKIICSEQDDDDDDDDGFPQPTPYECQNYLKRVRDFSSGTEQFRTISCCSLLHNICISGFYIFL